MVPNRLPISMPVCILLVSVVTLLQVAIATVDAATSSMGDNSLSPEQAQSLRAYLYWMKQLSMFDVIFGVFFELFICPGLDCFTCSTVKCRPWKATIKSLRTFGRKLLQNCNLIALLFKLIPYL